MAGNHSNDDNVVVISTNTSNTSIISADNLILCSCGVCRTNYTIFSIVLSVVGKRAYQQQMHLLQVTAVFISIAMVCFCSLPNNEVEKKDNCWLRFDRKKLDLSFWTSLLMVFGCTFVIFSSLPSFAFACPTNLYLKKSRR